MKAPSQKFIIILFNPWGAIIIIKIIMESVKKDGGFWKALDGAAEKSFTLLKKVS